MGFMVRQIIGVDCATKPSRVGLARARKSASGWELEEVCTGTRSPTPAEVVTEWISCGPEPILLALDAPLGWPVELGRALAAHHAGAALGASANVLFRRETDRVVRAMTGKQSLDVGADRIARTAHWTLGFLTEVRERTGKAIPLAWDWDIEEGARAIEVYPAATLRTHGVEIRGYKDVKNIARREAVVANLDDSLEVGPHEEALISGADTLDAAVCVLAGLDFLSGQAVAPSDRRTAEVEGWIWFKGPQEKEMS